jgi:N-acetyl-gamma-glutamyl-phosphate reductase
LIKDGLVDPNGIIVNSMSGVSGAGKKESLFYSFCEREGSALAYGLGRHRHLAEMEEQLCMAARKPVSIQFTPHLVPMARGIFTTTVIPSKGTVAEVYACWRKAFGKKQGIALLPTGTSPETRHVRARNRLDMSAYKDERTGHLLLTSAIDNLMKGASGQAVQIMNLRLGWPEFAGLV